MRTVFFLLGFDIGGTKIEAALFAAEATPRLVARQRLATERTGGFASFIEKMAVLADGVCTQAGVTLDQIKSIGISVTGSVDPRTQTVLRGNTLMLVGQPLVPALRAALGRDLPIVVDNDANCFALAEARAGVGRQHAERTGVPFGAQLSIGIILGTGVGGGIVSGGRVIAGRRGSAGEIGHMTLLSEGLPCYCGRRGCAETYLSGPALEGAAARQQYTQWERLPDSRRIFELAAVGDPIALGVVHEYRHHLARHLGNLTSAFDPDYFVLGGGLSSAAAIYEGLGELIPRYTFLDRDPPPVYPHSLGDSAGILGAALLCAE